jgi:uncharacterized protein (DUF486 family)
MSLLGYVPHVFSNPSVNAIALTIVPGILYTLASYGNAMFYGAGFILTLLSSLMFAACEYTFRLPLIEYSSTVANMSYGTQQIIWVIITLIFSQVATYLLPKYPVPTSMST